MAKFQWVRVTGSEPCPICKRPDWCCVSTDGDVCKCMRVEPGNFRSNVDKNGSQFYLHRLSDAPRAGTARPPRSEPGAKRADANVLNEVYSAFLKKLSLGKTHREALKDRGLLDEAIDSGVYRSLPRMGRSRIVRSLLEQFGDRLHCVPGFVTREGKSGRYMTFRGSVGLMVPCVDRAGRIVALKVRRDDDSAGGSRYTYCSSSGHGGPGSGAPIHFPIGTPETSELVRVIEGELKADVVWVRTGVPTVSIPGCGNWRRVLSELKAMGCKKVRLAFDADSWINPVVARALSDCADALIAAGFELEIERWELPDGKGLDDLLAAGKTPEILCGEAARQCVRDILAAACADEEPAPSDELDRLHDVLNHDGAEGLFRDKTLLQALADLSVSDPARFAAIRASIRGRVSVRDLDKALRSFRRPNAPLEGKDAPVYFEQDGCIRRRIPSMDGPIIVPLCNFTATIMEEIVHDDGAEQTCSLAMQGILADGSALPRIEVPAADFARMEWVVPDWGARAVVSAGQGMKDHLRAALQTLSGSVPRRTIFRHIGWRKIGESWFYLHAGGAIGTNGSTAKIPVSLPESLAGFRLPNALAPIFERANLSFGELEAARKDALELTNAVRASLSLLKLGPGRLMFPLLVAPFRAVLGVADFGVHLAGPTGSYKSEAAALVQQHFGNTLDARHLPANWSSTANALEGLAFAAKDAVLTIDDFCPMGSATDVQRSHKDADRVFRGQGNHAGRQRMRADSSLRPAKPPRGLTLSTGEDTPRGQSLRARLFVLEVSPGDLGPLPPTPNAVLTACQKDAADGKYAAALAGFVRWLAPEYEVIKGRLRAEIAELRDRAASDGQHARTPGIVGDLAVGLQYFLTFALAVGAISEAERADLWQKGWSALIEAAAAQSAQISTAEPASLFLRLFSAAVASGSAHVADKDGNAPNEPQRWGWRPEESYVGDARDTPYKPHGTRVGWLVDGELYLEPDSSFAVVQRFAQAQNDSFPITAHTLRRRLNERGFLASTESARGKLTVRKTIQGSRREVLHIGKNGTTSTRHAEPNGPMDSSNTESGPETWAGSGAENIVENDDSAREFAAISPENAPLGRKGQSDTDEEGRKGEIDSEHQTRNWGEWQ